MCKFFESWNWSNRLNIRFTVDFGLECVSDVSVNLTLRTEFSLSSVVHLWLHLSFAKQSKTSLCLCVLFHKLWTTLVLMRLATCTLPQYEKHAEAHTHKKSRNLKNEPPFRLLFHYVVRIAHAIFHSTRNFVSMGRYPPLFIPLNRSVCSFLVFIRFAIFLKAPACESLLILFWKTTSEKKTNSTGQIDAVNFFFCNISTV